MSEESKEGWYWTSRRDSVGDPFPYYWGRNEREIWCVRGPGIPTPDESRRVQHQERENAALRGFAKEVVSWRAGSVDGSDIEATALKFGLLEIHVFDRPCGDDCGCESMQEFPVQCYRATALLAAPAAPKQEEPKPTMEGLGVTLQDIAETMPPRYPDER